jgi:hypothetical protein
MVAIMKRNFALLFILLLFSSETFALSSKSKESFDSFFLAHPAEWYGECKGKLEGQAVVIIRPDTDTKSLKKGDPFYIVTHSSGTVRGILTRLLPPCKPSLSIDRVSYGLLRMEGKVDWDSSYDSLLAVKAKRVLSDQVGSVKTLKEDDPEKEAYLNWIRPNIPENRDFEIDKVIRIITPGFKSCPKTYYFILIYHFIVKGERIIREPENRSFLFLKGRETPLLLRQDEFLSRILGITDLDKDGVYEVLVHHTVSENEGAYEMRLFDGKTFSEPQKILYQWMD